MKFPPAPFVSFSTIFYLSVPILFKRYILRQRSYRLTPVKHKYFYAVRACIVKQLHIGSVGVLSVRSA